MFDQFVSLGFFRPKDQFLPITMLVPYIVMSKSYNRRVLSQPSGNKGRTLVLGKSV